MIDKAGYWWLQRNMGQYGFHWEVGYFNDVTGLVNIICVENGLRPDQLNITRAIYIGEEPQGIIL